MNLFTLNFKKIPKAFGIALLIIIIIELCSYLILLKIKSVVENNDLIKMDSDPLCRNLSVYNTEPPKDIKYLPKETNMSIKQIGSLGPYDVVVFGNSVTITGWCEILRLDHKVKICDLSAKIGRAHV